jgi:hypothetical protein
MNRPSDSTRTRRTRRRVAQLRIRPCTRRRPTVQARTRRPTVHRRADDALRCRAGADPLRQPQPLSRPRAARAGQGESERFIALRTVTPPTRCVPSARKRPPTRSGLPELRAAAHAALSAALRVPPVDEQHRDEAAERDELAYSCWTGEDKDDAQNESHGSDHEQHASCRRLVDSPGHRATLAIMTVGSFRGNSTVSPPTRTNLADVRVTRLRALRLPSGVETTRIKLAECYLGLEAQQALLVRLRHQHGASSVRGPRQRIDG